MTQRVEEDTRHKGEDKPSRLDLICTREQEGFEEIEYNCPVGKSDHVLTECILNVGSKMQRNEDHRIRKFI